MTPAPGARRSWPSRSSDWGSHRNSRSALRARRSRRWSCATSSSCPWQPAREGRSVCCATSPRNGPLTLTPAAYERAARESARHAEGIRTDLESIGLAAHLLRRRGGREAALGALRAGPGGRRRAHPICASTCRRRSISSPTPSRRGPTPSSCGARCAPSRSTCSDKTVMRIGEHVEQTRYVGSLPEQTWLGWLLYLMSAHCPFTVAVHVHATDRTRERLFHKRRYRRISRQQPREPR